MKTIFKIIIMAVIAVTALFGAGSVSAESDLCVPPTGWPYNEVQNFSKNSIETVFMGKVISKKETRQGGGYKYYEVVFDVKRSNFQKGQYPENGKIKVYTPVSEKLCGYSDSDYFSVGSYMTIYANKNNGLNITDKFSLNKKYSDEVLASMDLKRIVKNANKNIVVTEVSSGKNLLNKFLLYILFSGLAMLLVYYLYARKYHRNKLQSEENYFEDEKNMYFSTKNDEIEIRVRKNNNL